MWSEQGRSVKGVFEKVRRRQASILFPVTELHSGTAAASCCGGLSWCGPCLQTPELRGEWALLGDWSTKHHLLARQLDVEERALNQKSSSASTPPTTPPRH